MLIIAISLCSLTMVLAPSTSMPGYIVYVDSELAPALPTFDLVALLTSSNRGTIPIATIHTDVNIKPITDISNSSTMMCIGCRMLLSDVILPVDKVSRVTKRRDSPLFPVSSSRSSSNKKSISEVRRTKAYLLSLKLKELMKTKPRSLTLDQLLVDSSSVEYDADGEAFPDISSVNASDEVDVSGFREELLENEATKARQTRRKYKNWNNEHKHKRVTRNRRIRNRRIDSNRRRASHYHNQRGHTRSGQRHTNGHRSRSNYNRKTHRNSHRNLISTRSYAP